MAIRIYYKGEELDSSCLLLIGIILASVSLTFGLMLKAAIWGV